MQLSTIDVTSFKIQPYHNNGYHLIIYTYEERKSSTDTALQKLQVRYHLTVEPINNIWTITRAYSDDYLGAAFFDSPMFALSDDIFDQYDIDRFSQDLENVIQNFDTILDAEYKHKEEVSKEKYLYALHKAELQKENEREFNLLNEKALSTTQTLHRLNKSAMKSFQDSMVNASEDFPGNDCTNYVSKIIHSGGMPMDYNGKYQWWFKAPRRGQYAHSWSVVRDFRDYFINNNEKEGPVAYSAATFGELDTGDVIQMRFKGYNDYIHACVVYEAGGDPLVTVHSNMYSGRFSYRYNSYLDSSVQPTYKIKIRGYDG